MVVAFGGGGGVFLVVAVVIYTYNLASKSEPTLWCKRREILYIRQHGSAVYVGMVVVVCIP